MARRSSITLEPLRYEPGNPEFPTLPDGVPSLEIVDLFNVASLSLRLPVPPVIRPQRYSATPNDDEVRLGGWYTNKTWVVPSVTDFGVIPAQVQRTITLTNTRRDPVTVTAIDIPAAAGVTLLSPLPATVQPFASRVFTLEAGPEVGDAEFDELVTFTVSSGQVQGRIIGRRLFSLETIPQRGITERLRFRTDVIRSTSAAESAYSLATSPLSVCTYTLRIADDLERVRLRNAFMSGSSALVVGAQRWDQWRPLLAPVAASDVLLQVDTTAASFEAGNPVSVVPQSGAPIRATIESVAPGSLTLSAPIGAAVDDGVVVPVGLGFVSGFPDFATFAVNAEDFRYSVTYNRDAYLGAVAPGFLPLFDGELVLEVANEIENGQAKRISFDRAERALDSGITNRAARNVYPFGQDTVPFQTTIEGDTALWDWRRALHYLNGSWRRLWLPTFQPDLQYAGSLPNSNTFDVTNVGLSAFGSPPSSPRAALRFLYPDGSIEYRKITAVTDNGATEEIVVDGAIPAGSPVVGFLQRCRIVGDTCTFEHERPGRAVLSFTLRTLSDDL